MTANPFPPPPPDPRTPHPRTRRTPRRPLPPSATRCGAALASAGWECYAGAAVFRELEDSPLTPQAFWGRVWYSTSRQTVSTHELVGPAPRESTFTFGRHRLRRSLFSQVGRGAKTTTARRGVGIMDRTLTCRDCGQEFVFTAGEQAFYQERGFSEPQRCSGCRQARKAQRSADGYSSGSGSSAGGGSSYDSGSSYGGASRGGGGGGGYSSGPRQMFPATCAACGQQTEVPFEPRTDKPVYCRDCFQSRRPAPARSGYDRY